MPSIYQAMMAKQGKVKKCRVRTLLPHTQVNHGIKIRFFFITNCQLLATLEQCDLHSHSHCKKMI